MQVKSIKDESHANAWLSVPSKEEKCLFVVVLLILALILIAVLLVLILVLVLVVILLILILVVVLIVHSICNFLPTDFVRIPGEGIHTVLPGLRI
jgi:hypothetical protein